jgi:hypothetical protein
MKYWEIIADKLSAAGWSCAYLQRRYKMAGVGLLTPVPEPMGLKSHIQAASDRAYLTSVKSARRLQ